MIRFPLIPLALIACTYELELAIAAIASIDSEPLFMHEQTLVILLFNVRIGSE